ncbi:GSCOCG00004625001-RA-CDS [Cotesia congregata]|uniref:DUF4812 domain-containing protein n=1 Tax=Cotesia congregata TaxID=51543 RepID=A0A8J2MMK5_COTCN|nr:GSCOCG00004625001-RA-CDS [Cotesia congregata]CAG5095024.1 Protein of unknown function [Cotesia congregata]
MQAKKCCLHCPGTWVSSQEREEHTCNLPTYIKGNLKVSSLNKYVVGEEERSERLRGCPKKPLPTGENSCYDRFAIAKKFHAENLQHQPLPDKVNDSVFKNVNVRKVEEYSLKSEDKLNNNERRRLPRSRSCHKLQAGLQYAPALGCKTPTTNMDLAICWEAPIDPCYEPPRPTHIDGSEGGPAPAIFTLVQRENGQDVAHKSPMERFEAKFSNVKSRCQCNRIKNHNCREDNETHCGGCQNNAQQPLNNQQSPELNSKDRDLCDNFQSVHISQDHRMVKSGCDFKARRQPVHLRNCSPCHCRGDRTKRPRSRSIHSAPVYQGNRNFKRNGLPNKLTVPRPRTPYAKRDFCIDTLTPPFSIVEGTRDSEYPEHWRLTSVYQQSYKNPKKL